jgi:hypothetical protein
MISAILGQVTGQLDKRFLLNAFFPVLVFALALCVAYAAGTGGTTAGIATWDGQGTTAKVLLGIGGVTLVLVFANLLSNSMQVVIGAFEGYLGPARWVGRWAKNKQLAKMGALDEARTKSGASAREKSKAEDRLDREFPLCPQPVTADDIAPTRLGNVLRSSETYPMHRYGVDAVRAWPRLFPLLPESLLASMEETRASMEFLLAISFLCLLYAPAASIYLIVTAASLPWVFAVLVLPSAIALATYVTAVASAGVYGQQVRTAFDLHRLDLLRALGRPIPATAAEERRIWEDAMQLLERGQVTTWRYVLPSK